MKSKSSGFFWPSFADLMTSLFFIMLVLYILTIVKLKIKELELVHTVENLKHKLEVYELVERNIKPLKQDTAFFKYENQYKRFTLAFDVKFKLAAEVISISTLDTKDPLLTINQIDNAGIKLQQIINSLEVERRSNTKLKDVSYLLILSGYSSNLKGDIEYSEYLRSYNRAWNLWNHWRDRGIDFEAPRYKGLIDLQIAGNGWGGVGRFESFSEISDFNERKNQRFIIQIVPKIGNTNQE